MPSYQKFTSARTTLPDVQALQASLRTLLSDATVGLAVQDAQHVTVKKAAAWSAADIATAQGAIDTAQAWTPQAEAKRRVDEWPIDLRAFALVVVDQLNVLRVAAGMQPATAQQVMNAIKAKADTLS